MIVPVPDQRIFCHAPWYELQIYWDGSLGFCCQESHRIHDDDQLYNVRTMSVREWFDSVPMRAARMAMHGPDKISFCSTCYRQELHSNTSRRHKANQKSVIFTRSNFADSYLQSPGLDKFEKSRAAQGAFDGLPIDLHIDLGNYCNLTCKMCNPQASSRIAAQHVKWGREEARQYLLTDWTRDEAVWQRVLSELADIPSLRNVHFMGGETLITERFGDFVDFMLARGRADLNLSFVTNGTMFDPALMDKLLRFQRVGIEVSIETLTAHNAYQRQGTDTARVLENIDRYLALCDNDRVTLTARPAISALTIGNYPSLLEYCLTRGVVVKSLLCSRPRYYDAVILPSAVKKLYAQRYQSFLSQHDLDQENIIGDYNESDPNQVRRIIKAEVRQCLDILGTETPDDSRAALAEMVTWCRRWDTVHGLDARSLYPEFADILDANGY